MCSSNQTRMNYGVRKRRVVEHGVKMHQICIFYIDIDERVYDGYFIHTSYILRWKCCYINDCRGI